MKYQVKADDGKSFEVEAPSYEQAAQVAVRRLVRRRHLVAERTTGTHGKSGCFQGYYPDRKLNALNSVGPGFHVM